jgi:phosphoribosylaminoimidazolecarboxamide formyltransferase / IMP cyclohydrolase
MTVNPGLRKVRRALISVSDKTGIVDLALELKKFGVEIISTGGTAKALRDGGVDVLGVSDVTGFPEMMDGRVKTLHPKIHGGLLGVRDNPDHIEAMRAHGIQPIDLVVVNLYPFVKTIERDRVSLEEAIEQIDIGGPSMIRSAAKNFRDVVVVTSPDDYAELISELNAKEGETPLDLRLTLSARAFWRTADYDSAIFRYLASHTRGPKYLFGQKSSADATAPSRAEFALILQTVAELRYGENPHQQAFLCNMGDDGKIANAELLSGKEMSYNNYVDADAAWQLVCDFEENACTIIKHTNPAGVALGATTEEAYRRALACDPVSAFGGIVAFNRGLDAAAARAVTEIFVEVIIAPDFENEAIDVLKTKKNLRVLRAGEPVRAEGLEYKQISGGMLVQTKDAHRLSRADLKVVSSRAPSEKEIEDLLFAWTVCKHTKSNAIVYARDGQTVGVGAGQMSRVDSVKIGAMRAQLDVKGSVLASDAFFPFRDGIDEAAKHGITAVIQPGGSVRDEEVIAAANEHGLAMVFTGVRHFKH